MNKKVSFVFYGILYAAVIAFSYCFSKFTDAVFAIFVGVILLLLLVFINIKHIIDKNLKTAEYITAFIISGCSYFLMDYFSGFFYSIFFEKWIRMFNIIGCFVVYPYVCLILSCIKIITAKIKNNKSYTDSLPTVFLFSFTPFLFMPLGTMLSNASDYIMSIGQFVLPNIITALLLGIILQAYVSGLEGRKKSIAMLILNIISVCIYVQYMFMNGALGELNGFLFVPGEHIALIIINALIWLALIAFFVVLFVKKKISDKLQFYIPLFLFAVQLVAVISQLFTVSPDNYRMRQEYYDNSEMYTVAPGHNTIVFVFDAVDNDYIKKIYDENPGYFEDFKDYIMYTDTCSVYDCTPFSFPQMFTGCGFAGEEIADYNEAYTRLHDNDYIIDFYSYEWDTTMPDITKYIDNCYYGESASSKYAVSYTSILVDSLRLSAYQLLPYFAKPAVNMDGISFKSQISFLDAENEAIYDNNEFLDNISLTVSDASENRLIMIHLKGAHFDTIEFDEYDEETYTCLEIAKKYMNCLKELGLYDDATIILTADHGRHEVIEGDLMSATPMLMIKRPGYMGENMLVLGAPVYHTDFIKTILVDAGLYEESDGDRFGYSFYDFGENDERERVWYDRNVNNEYAVFTFTGNTETLNTMVEEGHYTAVKNESDY